ncbi:hypothetical protein BSZ39_01810 [Bowdeniella nasicola]|uniref:Metallo-beta-lactamase domain-containing protein n=1 Tax=Bowdeniella nasicola TaxID=208480 RepID=A0A1Q5Q4X8_9ACTO|nr:MBL fold metallo-hydrolase [Bowdeniella nasicola]OKL54841.1 hypothetical protein BSZ39_01810 [Bowdeniella nasicola]
MDIVRSSELTITRLTVGDMDNKVYLIRETDSGRVIVVDAAADADAILEAGQDEFGNVRIDRIITTHRHADHVQALGDVAARSAVKAYSGVNDAQAIQDATGVPQHPLADGDLVALGNVRITIVELVGHTPGGIALILRPKEHPPVVISGDSLFPGGVGKTHSPEDFTQLLGDVERKLFDALPDETVVLPGHGDATTLGAERGSLQQWRERGW